MSLPVHKHHRGAAMVEFAIVLPVLILLLVGTVQLGRLFSQIIWAANTNYEALRTGTELSASEGPAAMQQVFDSVMDNNYQRTGSTRTDANALTDKLYDTSSAQRTVQATSQGRATNIFSYLGLDFGVSYTGPLLLNDPGGSQPALNNFANDDGCYYDCSGTCQPAPSSAPCSGISVPTPIPVSCFSGGTPITMADGSQKPIRLIRVGEAVLAYDTSPGTTSPALVTHKMARRVNQDLLLNGSIRVTDEHPFFVAGEWKPAKSLKPGMRLLTVTGQYLDIQSMKRIHKPLVVFNMTVDGLHNYFAAGVLVHNKAPVPSFKDW